LVADVNTGPAGPVPLRTLFLTFLEVSLSAFGGGLVWIHRMVVLRRRWLSEEEFAEILSFCQFMPGPNIASVALCVGMRLRGTAGAAVSLTGFIVLPWTLGFAIGALCLRYAQAPLLHGALRGVSAAAAGMIVATGIRILRPHRRRPVALVFVVLAFAALAICRLPLWLIVPVLVPLSIAATAAVEARGRA
jgi:chromate transporter